MFETHEELYAVITAHREAAEKNGEEMFMGIPDRWFEDRTWRCKNDHVSKWYIKSEARLGDCCPACFEYVAMTFPEDKDGTPLELPPNTEK